MGDGWAFWWKTLRALFGKDVDVIEYGTKSEDDRWHELLDRRLIDLAGRIKLLDRKVTKRMSELSDAVAAIANDVTELQAASKRVLDLLTQPNPDVQSAVAALQNADAGFDAIRDSLNAAGGASTTPEPAPTEG